VGLPLGAAAPAVEAGAAAPAVLELLGMLAGGLVAGGEVAGLVVVVVPAELPAAVAAVGGEADEPAVAGVDAGGELDSPPQLTAARRPVHTIEVSPSRIDMPTS
jgi:hypothetical protein